MSDFSNRKSAWIQQMGDPMTIVRASGNISTHARFVKGRQLLAPFDINFVRFMVFPTDAGIQRGDLVKNATTGDTLLVTATEPRTMLGSITGVYCEMYVTNYPSVSVTRQTTSYDNNGNPTGTSWNAVTTAPMAVEHVNGAVPYKDGLLLADTAFRITMQTSVPIQMLDRVTLDGKPYQVSDINLTDSQNLQIVQVKTDMR